MKCIYCQGEMKKITAPFNINRKGYYVQWDAIPAWVCNQCGEPYFETEEVNQIQKALLALEKECENI